jgi:hypothetical protein
MIDSYGIFLTHGGVQVLHMKVLFLLCRYWVVVHVWAVVVAHVVMYSPANILLTGMHHTRTKNYSARTDTPMYASGMSNAASHLFGFEQADIWWTTRKPRV